MQIKPCFVIGIDYRVLELQLTVILAVHSLIRESDLMLLISSLEETVGLCLSSDHHDFKTWLSVFIREHRTVLTCSKSWGGIFL